MWRNLFVGRFVFAKVTDKGGKKTDDELGAGPVITFLKTEHCNADKQDGTYEYLYGEPKQVFRGEQ